MSLPFKQGRNKLIIWKNYWLHTAAWMYILQFVCRVFSLIPDRYRLWMSSCVVTVLVVLIHLNVLTALNIPNTLLG